MVTSVYTQVDTSACVRVWGGGGLSPVHRSDVTIKHCHSFTKAKIKVDTLDIIYVCLMIPSEWREIKGGRGG